MKCLNLASGATRPGDPWVNLDNLHATLFPGTEERKNLDAEERAGTYVNHDLVNGGPMPFADETFDCVWCSHFIEHVDCMQAVEIIKDCRRILKPNGDLWVSVPDAKVFRDRYHKDTVEAAPELFGEPIYLPDGETTFFGYALWNKWHRAILSEDALWCYFVRAGFDPYYVLVSQPLSAELLKVANRPKFSLIMKAYK